MKITIEVVDRGGIRYETVDGSMPFEMYGFTFVAHRRYLPDLPPRNQEWRVSELSTGMGASRFLRTRTEAIRDAKKILEKVGEIKVIKEVKKQLRRQKREGRLRP